MRNAKEELSQKLLNFAISVKSLPLDLQVLANNAVEVGGEVYTLLHKENSENRKRSDMDVPYVVEWYNNL